MSIISEYENKFGTTFDCECGKQHTIQLKNVVIKQQALHEIPLVLAKEKLGAYGLLLCDDNTWSLAGKHVEEVLRSNSYNVKTYILNEKPMVKPDEKSIAHILLEFDPSMDFIIAVGSGTLNDLARFISYKTGKPYIIYATAPSMDGYASTVSPLLINGFKRTYTATHPIAIIADTHILCSAPDEMILAGFGDILGKLTSLADWQLGHVITGEDLCPTAMDMVANAVQEVLTHAREIGEKDPNGIKALMGALILSGIAMMLVGNSRPASGSEHHISHYLEMKYFLEKRQPLLHGTKVGLATLYTVALYNQMAHIDPSSINIKQLVAQRPGYKSWYQDIRQAFGPIAEEVIEENGSQDYEPGVYEQRLQKIVEKWHNNIKPVLLSVPSLEKVNGWLSNAKGDFSPTAINIEPDLIKEALLHAKEIRTRYTILRLACDLGILKHQIKKISDLI